MRICPRCGVQTDASVCPDDGANTIPVGAGQTTYPAGTVIAERYRLDSVLGIGGFGAVYKGVQLAMDQVVAVKVLRSEHIQSEEHVKRFAREARAASKLRHANTIRLFDFGSHSDHALYLAMEYLEGETLAARMDRDGAMAAERVVHIMSQVCHSLTEAHEQGIVHRDLKPENIMIVAMAGEDDFVKVLDFGIAAKVAESGDNDEKLTEMGMIMGTPTYMSPEQALGKTLDARSDIYALGVLLYEALSDHVPFEGDQPMNVLVRHINDPPVSPSKRNPEAKISPAIERIVLRCLEKDPKHRPQSTAELAAELERALANPDGGLRRGPVDLATQEIDAEAAIRTAAIAALASAQIEPRGVTSAVPSQHGIATPSSRPSSFALSPAAPSRSPVWLGIGALLLIAAMIGLVIAFSPAPETPAIETNPGGANVGTTALGGANAAAGKVGPGGDQAAGTVAPAGEPADGGNAVRAPGSAGALSAAAPDATAPAVAAPPVTAPAVAGQATEPHPGTKATAPTNDGGSKAKPIAHEAGSASKGEPKVAPQAVARDPGESGSNTAASPGTGTPPTAKQEPDARSGRPAPKRDDFRLDD